MELSDEILQAARELGQALRASQAVQEHLEACEAVNSSAGLVQLEAAVQQRYHELVKRQQAGQVLFPHEVNEFYKLQDQVIHHPLIVRRTESLETVKSLYEGTAGSLSNILSIDFTALVSQD